MTSSPVTDESATIGTPTEPNATGAVLASSETSTAIFGWKPTPTSRNAVIATGAPKPALPSSSAPKQKATSTACTHGSPDARSSIHWRSRSNEPARTERLYSQSALKTSQRIDHAAVAKPKTMLQPARLSGMRQTRAGEDRRDEQTGSRGDESALPRDAEQSEHGQERDRRDERGESHRVHRRDRLGPRCHGAALLTNSM